MSHNYLLILQIIIITIFLPLAFFYLLRTFGKVDSIMLSELHQRKIPLLMQMALTLILITKSVTIFKFPELFYFFLGGLLSTFFTYILLFFRIKASIHILGMVALTFFVFGMSMHFQINSIFTMALLFFIIGIVASSRLQMKAHSMQELIIGMAVGTLPQITLWIFWL